MNFLKKNIIESSDTDNENDVIKKKKNYKLKYLFFYIKFKEWKF